VTNGGNLPVDATWKFAGDVPRTTAVYETSESRNLSRVAEGALPARFTFAPRSVTSLVLQ
ncbi:MAG TPA: hypothetical protein VFL82_13775, partial [Thermomicrobiales bacterium]|nr:hypothetical protein [Thermomicrobiales bacterium]